MLFPAVHRTTTTMVLRRGVASRRVLSCLASSSFRSAARGVAAPVPWVVVPRRGLASSDPPNAAVANTAAEITTAPSGDVVATADDDDGASARGERPTTRVRLYPVYSRYDVEDLLQNEDVTHGNAETYARDAAVALSAPLEVTELHRLAKEAFGTIQDLQYHNGRTWAPLLVADDVTALRQSLEQHPRGLERIVPIRVPQYFDEFGHSRADPSEEDQELEDDDELDASAAPVELPPADDSARTDRGLTQMAQMIQEMLVQLRSPDSPWQICEDGRLRWTVDPQVTLSTRAWILGLAEHEPPPDPKEQRKGVFSLRQLLYLYPGALDHMANSLHLLHSLPPLPPERAEDADAAEPSAAGATQDAVV